MRWCRTLWGCAVLAAALAVRVSEHEWASDPETDVRSADTDADAATHHSHYHSDKTHKKCKKAKKKPTKQLWKARNGWDTVSNGLGPMGNQAGAVRDYEDLSQMSSLKPKFWVRNKLPNKIMNQTWNQHSDCFYGSRNTMRPYPKYPPGIECYQLDFSPRRVSAWWNFWAEIRGDLEYAFDFVMWDEYEQYHETNQFWYLMMYLKTLLKRVPNPNSISTKDQALNASHVHNKEGHIDDCDDHLDEPPAGDEASVEQIREMLKEYHEKLEHLETLITSFS